MISRISTSAPRRRTSRTGSPERAGILPTAGTPLHDNAARTPAGSGAAAVPVSVQRARLRRPRPGRAFRFVISPASSPARSALHAAARRRSASFRASRARAACTAAPGRAAPSRPRSAVCQTCARVQRSSLSRLHTSQIARAELSGVYRSQTLVPHSAYKASPARSPAVIGLSRALLGDTQSRSFQRTGNSRSRRANGLPPGDSEPLCSAWVAEKATCRTRTGDH